MVFIDESGVKYYSLFIFRLGKNRYSGEEWALALLLRKIGADQFRFDFDKFLIPEGFPETETYSWEEVDENQIPNISKIKNHPGFHYLAEDVDKLKEKFNI